MLSVYVSIVLTPKDFKKSKNEKANITVFIYFRISFTLIFAHRTRQASTIKKFLLKQPPEAAKAHACDVIKPVIQRNKRHHK